MTESTMKRFKSLGSSDASDDLLERPITKREVPIDRHMSRICVEGYDTSLYEYDLQLALRKHFSSCGEILQIYVPRNFEKGILERCAFIRLAGEGTLEKALELSGSYVEVGGWQVFAKETTYKGEYTGPPVGDVVVFKKHLRSERSMIVMGYDTSLPEIDLQIGLSKYFSSCGEVTAVSILPTVRRARINIRGEGAVDKALQLSGRDVGGWNITVASVMPPWDAIQNFPTSNRSSPMIKAMIMEAKMRGTIRSLRSE